MKVLLFSAYDYSRDALEKMTPQELYKLASVASTLGYDETDVLTLEKFQEMANNDILTLENVWIYFVNI